jgi:hypothetical protein
VQTRLKEKKDENGRTKFKNNLLFNNQIYNGKKCMCQQSVHCIHYRSSRKIRKRIAHPGNNRAAVQNAAIAWLPSS